MAHTNIRTSHSLSQFPLATSICALLLLFSWSEQKGFAQAQYVEDALRYTLPNNMYSVRQGALGLAYNGIADDAAAAFTNPAGLTLLPAAEFSVGLQGLFNNNTSTYLGNTFVRNSNTIAPSHLALVLPVRVGESGNFSFSFSYARESDFTRFDSLSGFNTESTLISSWVDGQRTNNLTNNFAWRLKLADTVNRRFVTPVRNNLQQNMSLRESGELHNVNVGFGIDITPQIALGVSFIGTFGELRSFRRIQEIDLQNRYNRLDRINFSTVDFFRLSYAELLTQSVSGLKFVIGAQGRIGEKTRIGASCTLPLPTRINENFSRNAIARFDPITDSIAYNPTDSPTISYLFSSPFVFNVAASTHLDGLTVSGSAEYMDFQGLNFQGGNFAGAQLDANAINVAARDLLRTQVRVGLGAEYEFAGTPFVVRGSCNYASSPFADGKADVSPLLTGAVGVGYYLGTNGRLDALYRVNQQNSVNQIYEGATFRSTQNLHLVAVQYSVRF